MSSSVSSFDSNPEPAAPDTLSFNHVVCANHDHYNSKIITLKFAGDENSAYVYAVHQGIAESCPFLRRALRYNADKTRVEYKAEDVPFSPSALFFLVDFMYSGKFKPAKSVHDFLRQSKPDETECHAASSPAIAVPEQPPPDATGKHVDSPGCRCLLCHNSRADGTRTRQAVAHRAASPASRNNNSISNSSTRAGELPKLAAQDMQTWELLLDVHVEAFLCGEYHGYAEFCGAVAASLIGMFEMAGEYAARTGVLRRCISLFERLAEPDNEMLVPVVVRVAYLLPRIRSNDKKAVEDMLADSPGFVTLALMQAVSRGVERKQLPRMT